jgi:hypothetical protein
MSPGVEHNNRLTRNNFNGSLMTDFEVLYIDRSKLLLLISTFDRRFI